MSYKLPSLLILILLLLSQPFTVLPRTLRSQNLDETPQGVVEVGGARRYLKAFGYLDQDNVDFDDNMRMNADSDELDQGLEKAVRMFQEYYQLNVSGKLDSETTKLLSSPRCGVPDHDHGTKKKQDVGSNLFKVTSKYAFIDGSFKWPKRNLTYKFESGVEVLPTKVVREAFREAFAEWSSASAFSFKEAPSGTYADIVIGFFSGDHGDGSPFNESGVILAHAFAPPDGRLHVNADKPWSTQVPIMDGYFDLVWVAMHEIGHVLGLDHSNHHDAVMYAFIDPGVNKRKLRADDINGIQGLYSTPVREDSHGASAVARCDYYYLLSVCLLTMIIFLDF